MRKITKKSPITRRSDVPAPSKNQLQFKVYGINVNFSDEKTWFKVLIIFGIIVGIIVVAWLLKAWIGQVLAAGTVTGIIGKGLKFLKGSEP